VIIRKFVHDELKCLRFQITLDAYFLRGSIPWASGKGRDPKPGVRRRRMIRMSKAGVVVVFELDPWVEL
jgi:hypothetical protein